MIPILLSFLLSPTSSANAGEARDPLIAPVGVQHPATYYDHREQERKKRLERIEADRVKEHGLRMDYERQTAREPGSIYLWRDSPKQHEAKRQLLQDQELKHEQARQVQEQIVHDEDIHDRRERGLPDGANL